ncbi:hypothetical protein A3Q56_05815 [Intoshia linei]|uniref:Uncharacterized protein n=1 Tax=Intoshia linei TaxID=1819745 RepID=A0A177AWV1_9BILA|nr:hypothetical protein A3Q56_05815 [Intoshia linei]
MRLPLYMYLQDKWWKSRIRPIKLEVVCNSGYIGSNTNTPEIRKIAKDRPSSYKTLDSKLKLKELARILGPVQRNRFNGEDYDYVIKVMSTAREEHNSKKLKHNQICQKYREAKRLRCCLNNIIP